MRIEVKAYDFARGTVRTKVREIDHAKLVAMNPFLQSLLKTIKGNQSGPRRR